MRITRSLGGAGIGLALALVSATGQEPIPPPKLPSDTSPGVDLPNPSGQAPPIFPAPTVEEPRIPPAPVIPPEVPQDEQPVPVPPEPRDMPSEPPSVATPELAPPTLPTVPDIPTPVPSGTDIPEPMIPEPEIPPPDVPAPEVFPEPEAPPVSAPSPSPAAGADLFGGLGARTELGGVITFAAPEVFGDNLGLGTLQIRPPVPSPPPPLPRPPVPPRPPVVPGEGLRAPVFITSIRGFKIAENQSPAPRDRVFYTFNYYKDVNESINRRFNFPVTNIQAYRHAFGFERLIFSERSSFGMRLPIDTVSGDSPLPTIGETSTSVGDLNIFAKYAFYVDQESGSLLSTGLSMNLPTGPASFGGARWLETVRSTNIQPFIGMLFVRDRFFFQGFTSIEVPFSRSDVTMLYNDYALGYFLYRSEDPGQFLSSIIPVFEVHVNTPLNRRGIRFEDPASQPDVVNLTYGTAFQFGRRTRLLAGLATPVTGPRPFDLEVLALLNIYY